MPATYRAPTAGQRYRHGVHPVRRPPVLHLRRLPHEGIRLIDTRHEQTATFAAEGWSKVTRVPGVAALTAGPGITNGMSAMAAAQQNSSPLLVLGGRAPALRWGMGSLQEIDHVPFVAPLARFAATAQSAEAAGRLVDEALRATVGAPSGVGFVDFPMDHVFSHVLHVGR